MTIYRVAVALMLTFPAFGQFGNANRLQGRKIDPVAPTDTQALVWDAASASWKPGSGGGGGGGITGITGTTGGNATGPTVTFALSFTCATSSITRSSNTITFCFPPFATKAFLPVRTNATTLTTNSNCGAAPNTCQSRFGNTAYQYAASPRAILGSGTGIAFGYVAAGGAWTVGHNVTMSSCDAGLTCTGGVTDFPVGSIPKWKWTITGGNWDASGFEDWRDDGSTKIIACAGGLTQTDSGGTTTCAVDTTAIVQKFFGSGAPGTILGNQPGDVYYRDNGTNYDCDKPSGTASPACTGVGASNWVARGGGGATIPSVSNVIKGDGAGNGADTKVAFTSPTTAATVVFGTDNLTHTMPAVSGTLMNATSTATITNKTPGQSWIPSVDSTYSLGDGSHYWANSSIVNGGFVNLGTATLQFGSAGSTVSGCSNTPVVAGRMAGSFTSGVNGTCTVTITMGGSFTATNDLLCIKYNLTAPNNIVVETASTTSTVTLTGTTTSGDLIKWGCIGI